MDESSAPVGDDRAKPFLSRKKAKGPLQLLGDRNVGGGPDHVAAVFHPSHLSVVAGAAIAAGYPNRTPSAPEGLQPAEKIRLEANCETAGALKLV